MIANRYVLNVSTAVNPGLDVDLDATPHVALRKDPKFREVVQALFGTSDPRVMKATEDFVRRRPGTFDHHRLRFVAAAAPLFTDKNHVAYMIDRLATTQMDVAMSPVDIATAKQHLAIALEGYRPETARKLVLDLVHQSTLRILDASPPDRVPEGGREILRAEARKTIKGGLPRNSPLLSFVFPSADMAVKALDEAETAVDAAEAEAEAAGRAGSVNVETIASNLLVALDSEIAEAMSDEQLGRAWMLFERCENSQRSFSIVASAASNPRMCRTHGDQLLDWLDEYGRRFSRARADAARGQMLSAPGLPETVARRAVAAGVSRTPAHGPARLQAVRAAQYRRTDELLGPMTSDELDRAVVTLVNSHTGDNVTGDVIEEMKDPESLAAIARMSTSLTPHARAALVEHPALGPELVGSILERHLASPSLLERHDGIISPLLTTFLMSSKLNDRQLDDLLRIAGPRVHRRPNELLLLAARNRSAGELICRRISGLLDIVDSDGHPLLGSAIEDIANNSTSAHVHELLTDFALRTESSKVAQALLRNGIIRNSQWQRLRENFPHLDTDFGIEELNDPYARSRTYDARDIVQLLIEGEAAPGRLQTVIEADIDPGRPIVTVSGVELVAVLNEHHLIPSKLVTELTGHADRHIALGFATDPKLCSHESLFRQPAERALAETVDVISKGAVRPADKGLRSWSQLSSREDVPLPYTPVHELIDGAIIGDLHLRVPKSGRDVTKLAKRMGNCLDGYKDRVSKGDRVVAYADLESDTYAVMWTVGSTAPSDTSSGIEVSPVVGVPADATPGEPRHVSIHVLEMNSRFNQGDVPPWFRTGIARLTDDVNNGSLLASRSLPSPSPAPARRRAIPQFRSHVTDAAAAARPALDPATPPLFASADAPEIEATDRAMPGPEQTDADRQARTTELEL